MRQKGPFSNVETVGNGNLGRMLGADSYLDKFEAWLRSWNAAETTITGRLTALRAALRCWDPLTVTTGELEYWLAQPGFAPWTRVTYYGHVRSLFSWLRRAGLRVDDPTLDLLPPATPKGKPRPLTAAERSLAISHATGQLRAWLLLGFLAGLRAHETAKLRGEDVTPETIFVHGKGGQEAFVPTHDQLWELARTYPRRGFWFPGSSSAGHVSPKTISKRTTALFAGLGIEGSYHRTRHTYGTGLLRGGANIRVVQELMRHESLASTQIYTDVEDEERRRAIASLGMPIIAA